jgi:hypothetical protein
MSLIPLEAPSTMLVTTLLSNLSSLSLVMPVTTPYRWYIKLSIRASLRADGIILLVDEGCFKDLILDTYGVDPALVSSQAVSSNILHDNVLQLTSPRRLLRMDLTSMLVVPHFYPLDSCLWLIQQGASHTRTVFDSPELFSNTNKIFLQISFQHHEVLPWLMVYNMSVNVCCVHYYTGLGCNRYAPVALMM